MSSDMQRCTPYMSLLRIQLSNGHRNTLAVCMGLLLYFIPVSAAFGLFLGSDTLESNPLDIIWSQTYNVFLNTIKLILAVIFAFFLDSVRTCLVLVLILFIVATLLSATYFLRHKHSPCSSHTLWYTRTYLFATATLLTAVCLLFTATAKVAPSFTVVEISEESFYRGAGSISWNTFRVSPIRCLLPPSPHILTQLFHCRFSASSPAQFRPFYSRFVSGVAASIRWTPPLASATKRWSMQFWPSSPSASCDARMFSRSAERSCLRKTLSLDGLVL